MDPNRLRFASSHEWVALEGTSATIGISDFAVRELTDLVFIQLPEIGRRLKEGEAFGEVESVKAVSDLYAPLAGEVVSVNSSLVNDLAPLSDDAFGAGWIIKLEVDDPSAAARLMDYEAYQRFCEAESQ